MPAQISAEIPFTWVQPPVPVFGWSPMLCRSVLGSQVMSSANLGCSEVFREESEPENLLPTAVSSWNSSKMTVWL